MVGTYHQFLRIILVVFYLNLNYKIGKQNIVVGFILSLLLLLLCIQSDCTSNHNDYNFIPSRPFTSCFFLINRSSISKTRNVKPHDYWWDNLNFRARAAGRYIEWGSRRSRCVLVARRVCRKRPLCWWFFFFLLCNIHIK